MKVHSIDELVKILEACKNAGVKKIKWGDLRVSFRSASGSSAPESKADLQESNHSRDPVETLEIETDPVLHDLQMQSFMISDPVEFEEYLRKAQNAEVGERS